MRLNILYLQFLPLLDYPQKLKLLIIESAPKLTQLLLDMETKGYTINIREIAQMKDGTMNRLDCVYDCRVSGNEYELKPDERTVEKLSFKGSKRRVWINGKEVKKTV